MPLVWVRAGFIVPKKLLKCPKEKRFCKIELTLISDDPVWYREETYSFFSDVTSKTPSGNGETAVDYPAEYPFGYVLPRNSNIIVCNSVRDNSFKLKIYGAITNPTVTIGGQLYAVNGTVKERESLLIDSTTKTITMTRTTGQKENWFDNRNRDSYIFEPIPPGQNIVVKNGSFGVELTVIEKRSEPKWT